VYVLSIVLKVRKTAINRNRKRIVPDDLPGNKNALTFFVFSGTEFGKCSHRSKYSGRAVVSGTRRGRAKLFPEVTEREFTKKFK